MPVTIVHFVTNRCNARCAHCFIDFNDKQGFKGDLSLEEIQKFVRRLPSTLRNVNLTGGEPFLRNDLVEIVEEYFSGTKISSIYITSNGYFTDRIQALAQRFLAKKEHSTKKLIVSISIDNLQAEHDRNRKIDGLFVRALASYHMLRELADPRLISNVNLCVTPENCDRIEDIFRDLVEEHGIRSLTSIIVRGKPLDAETRQRVCRKYIRLNQLIDEGLASGKLEGYGKSLLGRALNAKNVILHREVAGTFLTNEYRSPCFAGGLSGIVYANGDVYPCEMLSMKMGNLRENHYDLCSIFESYLARKTRQFIRRTNCRCTYECAWAVNILLNPRFGPSLALELLRRGLV